MKRMLFALLPAALIFAACGGTASGQPAASAAANIPTPPSASLTGAGSSFDYPFFNSAFYAFNQKYSQVSVNYQSIGSGGGILALTNKTVDFGASDVPLKTTEANAMGGSDAVVQIPITLGAVSLAYNIQGVGDGQLKLTPDLIARIFQGKIKYWDDAAITGQNGGLSLPHQSIYPVVRSDGSGTTYIFTDYLSTVSADFKSKIGTGKKVSWPAGFDAEKGNEAVATKIKQQPGAIGYVELAYVLQTQMTQAKLQNADGNFVLPSAGGATAAAAAKPNVSPTDFSIVNMPGKDATPIAGYSWVIAYKAQPDKSKGQALVDLLYWMVQPAGQGYASALHYATLPSQVVQLAVTSLKAVTYQGTPLLTVS